MRVDSGVLSGTEITPLYDPMVAKLIVWDADRELATRRMLRALKEYEIEGVKTLIPFHKAIMASEQWAKGGDLPRPHRGQGLAEAARLRGRAEGRRRRGGDQTRDYTVEVGGKRFEVEVHGEAVAAAPRPRRQRRAGRRRRSAASASAAAEARGGDTLSSPLQGNVWKVLVEQGQRSRRARSSASSRR